VSFAEDMDEHFDIQTDERFPGQFRVTGNRIEKVVAMTNWDYYESIRRFQRILEATGISKALKKAGAVQGDMVMVGEWDFNYWEPRNRWIAELGLDEINPRQRYGREE
jgi:Obg family GTPase CgtA-like protein